MAHSPVKNRRMLASGGFFGAGGYDGSRTDRSALRNWTPLPSSADADIVPALQGLRGRTRDLARNAPLIAGALDTHLTSTVGPGVIPHPRIDREFLQLTEEQADAWQKQASRIWWALAGSRQLDIKQRLTFAQMTWIVLRSWFTDGDHFFRRRYVKRSGDMFGLKVQLLEADRISNPNFEPDRPPLLVEGIEMDSDGVPLAVYVASRHPTDSMFFVGGMPTWTRQPIYSPNIGELLMGHVWLPERADQTRGVSILAPVIESVKQLTRYAGAELDAAVTSSFIMAVLTTETGDELESMGTGGNPPAVGFMGGPGTASADRQIELAPAAIPELRPGEKLEAFNPQRPNSGFDQFFRAFCSIIGVASGLPHELLIKHFTSSYSASRGALLEAWRGFKTKRQLIVVDQWAQPVYDWTIYEAVSEGLLDAPGFFDDPLIRQAYCECQWSGPVMGQLNPKDEVEAARARVELTISTLEEETAEITGGDEWERKLVQREKEEKLRRAANLTLPTTSVVRISEAGSPPAAANPANDGGGTSQDNADAGEQQSSGGAGGSSSQAIEQLSESVRALAERPPAPVNVTVEAPQVTVAPGDVHVHLPPATKPGKQKISKAKDGSYIAEDVE